MSPPEGLEILERYRSLIENSTDGILEASRNSPIIQASKAMTKGLTEILCGREDPTP